jgi:hypothetical protein
MATSYRVVRKVQKDSYADTVGEVRGGKVGDEYPPMTQAVVWADNEADALVLGAQTLGLATSQVEVAFMGQSTLGHKPEGIE